mgnify:CR=1 FL=1
MNPRRLTLAVVFTIQAALFAVGAARENHWSRPAGEVRLRDFATEIERFQQDARSSTVAATLYIPAPIPYWGLVLESAGGFWHHPDGGIVDGLGVISNPNGVIDSWLGRFELVPTAEDTCEIKIDHERWGRLRYTGIEAGRIWFADKQDRQLFTSKLFYPYAWRIGPTGFTLSFPSPSEG